LSAALRRCAAPALAAAFAALVLAWTTDAQAYPWMIRHGYFGCTTCHADPSGGELLTPYGRAQGDLLLRARYGSDTVSAQASETKGSSSDFDSFDSFDSDDSASKAPAEKPKPRAPPAASDDEAGPSPSAGFLWGLVNPPEWLWLGGSYRHAFLYQRKQFRTFPMQLDLFGELRFGRVRAGGSLGGARVPAGSPYARAAQITPNQGNDWNLISRTHWLGVDIGAEREVTVRAGRLNLPFGVRIPEHIMWVRSTTHTDRESAQQHGVAVAWNAGQVRGEIMGIAGNYQIRPDEYRERGYSGFAEILVADGLALGASSKFTIAQADRYTLVHAQTAQGAHGPFARVRIAEPVVLLTEADVLDTGRRQLGYVGYLALDFEPVQGLHFGASGEVLDQGYADATRQAKLPRSAGDGKPRFGGWGTIDWFFLPDLELRLDAIARQSSDVWWLAQLHAYL
jgi:hypothetical protein